MLPAPQPATDHNRHFSKKFKFKTTVKPHFSSHHCACLAFTVLLQLLIVLFLITRSLPPSTPRRYKSCKHGLIYVYDLPSILNQDLLDDCDNLDSSSSRCKGVSNGGIGLRATGLDAIVPANLSGAWYWTDKYFAEIIYHDRINHYPCTTSDPAAAAAFYIPFYAALAVGKYLYNHTAKDRDHHAATMLDWVKEQPWWRRSNGSDHFLMLGRPTWDFRRLTDDDDDWGTSLTYMPLMKNVFRLTVERDRWDPLEVSVPYPTAFHPRSGSDIRQWQGLIRARQRPSLFTFVGAIRESIRNDFRRLLMDYCKGETTSCKVVDCFVTPCGDGSPAMFEAFLDSDFCLQPKGDGLTRRSAFDCMLTGSIPVYFWNGSFEYQYEWHMPHGDASKYSIFIDHNTVRNDSSIIKRTLESYSREKVTGMRENIIEQLPKLLYAKSKANLGEIKDAFDIAMEGVLKRFEEQKMGQLRQ